MICLILSSPRRKLDAARKTAGLTGSILSPIHDHVVALITPSMIELEYPHVPGHNTVFAGPIVHPEEPVSEKDYPQLAGFLQAERTVLVNMGSLFQYTEDDVRSMCHGIQLARAQLRDKGRQAFHVLWKLPKKNIFMDVLQDELGNDKAIRIEEWIDPPLLAVLSHPNVVLSVHHGGASKSALCPISFPF
jgi:hypothetical protein